MLFQLMMGKSMWEFSSPCTTRPSHSSSPAKFLRTPLRTSCESGKYFLGLSWMRLNGKIDDKHKKQKVKKNVWDRRLWMLLFLMDLTKRSSIFIMFNWSLSLYKIKKYIWLHVESNILHLPLLTQLRNLYFLFINTLRNPGHSVCFFLIPKAFQYHLVCMIICRCNKNSLG